jgi:hypothetical protein
LHKQVLDVANDYVEGEEHKQEEKDREEPLPAVPRAEVAKTDSGQCRKGEVCGGDDILV